VPVIGGGGTFTGALKNLLDLTALDMPTAAGASFGPPPLAAGRG
jgi:hypothetical protein